MRFLVELIDEHVKRLEEQDDTVMAARLQSIIIKELQAFNSNVYRASIKVRELAPNEKIR